jgi:hypothetical protein
MLSILTVIERNPLRARWLGALRLNCKTSRLLASLPNLPHLEIGRLDVVSEAVGVEQRMRQPVRRQSIAISFEK